MLFPFSVRHELTAANIDECPSMFFYSPSFFFCLLSVDSISIELIYYVPLMIYRHLHFFDGTCTQSATELKVTMKCNVSPSTISRFPFILHALRTSYYCHFCSLILLSNARYLPIRTTIIVFCFCIFVRLLFAETLSDRINRGLFLALQVLATVVANKINMAFTRKYQIMSIGFGQSSIAMEIVRRGGVRHNKPNNIDIVIDRIWFELNTLTQANVK